MAGSSLLYYVGVVVLVCVRCDDDHQHAPSSFSTSSGQREKRSAETEEQQTPSYWLDQGQTQLSQALLLEPNKRMAKNIILVIGDGMSLSTNTAGRIFKGQSQGRDGVSEQLSWDQFPHIGQSRSRAERR